MDSLLYEVVLKNQSLHQTRILTQLLMISVMQLGDQKQHNLHLHRLSGMMDIQLQDFSKEERAKAIEELDQECNAEAAKGSDFMKERLAQFSSLLESISKGVEGVE